VLLILAVCLFSLAIALYASSMGQVPVVEDRKIETRTQIEWEVYLLSFLGGMEGRHKWGSRSFVLGLSSLTAIPTISLIQYIFRCLSP
jgi:hypothetical protein